MEAVELDYSDTTADVSSSLKAPSPPLPVLPTLTLEYGILKMIFGYLNIRDLLTCLKVSKHWNEVGTIVRRQRLNKPELLLYHLFPIERTREVVELSNDLELSDSTVTWANDPGTQSRQAELEGSGSRTRILQSELEPRFWSAVVSQFSEPSRIICVGTSNLIPYLTLGRESRGEGSEEHETSVSSSGRKIDLFRRLGKIAPCIGLIGYGIVLTLPDNSACFENEQQPAGHRVFLPMITGIVIPKIQGLKVSMFSLTARQRMEKVSADNCEKILNIQPEDKVKGIVLFQSFQKIGRENHLLSAICEYLKKNPRVAFGGGLFQKSFTSQEAVIGCGLVFSGDDSVRVASAAFLECGMTENNLLNLRKLKEARMEGRTGKDFAFMFCCNGRGSAMHEKANVESSLFRSEYPNVPVIGAFTGGEYFWPFVPSETEDPPQPVLKHTRDLKFGYTTVFVYVSSS